MHLRKVIPYMFFKIVFWYLNASWFIRDADTRAVEYHSLISFFAAVELNRCITGE